MVRLGSRPRDDTWERALQHVQALADAARAHQHAAGAPKDLVDFAAQDRASGTTRCTVKCPGS
jgi:hypothetical protein